MRLLLAGDAFAADWIFDANRPFSEIPSAQDQLLAAAQDVLRESNHNHGDDHVHDHNCCCADCAPVSAETAPVFSCAQQLPPGVLGPVLPYDVDAVAAISTPQLLLGESDVFDTHPLSETFFLHSKSDSDYTIYLDFDGHTTTGTTWNNSSRPSFTSDPYSIDGDFQNFSDTELRRIQGAWARVAEDFAPFDVNVTTEEPDVERLKRSGSGDQQYGVRVVISQDSDWLGSSPGGIAYYNSFRDRQDEPVFVFTSSEKAIAEATTHEVGHSLGLSHDGRGNDNYYDGHGSGATSWGPVMGSGYLVQLTQFSQGEYSNATTTEDDLAIITDGFIPFRQDDYGDTTAAAQSLYVGPNGELETVYGVVSQRTDVDVFSFVADAGQADIQIDPPGFGANMDIRARLLDSEGQEIAVSNPLSDIDASFSLTLPASGVYYVEVDGVGRGDPTNDGYSDYGSLGHFRVTGNVQPMSRVDATGTEADDLIEVDVSSNPYVVTVNGDSQTYSAEMITEIQVQGGGGWDRLVIVGGDDDDAVSGAASGATYSNNGVVVTSTEIQEHDIAGGGGSNTAVWAGTDGDDTLTNTDGAVFSRQGVFQTRLVGFGGLRFDGGLGSDTAELRDTPAFDTWTVELESALLSSVAGSTQTDHFERVSVTASQGGRDTVRFVGGDTPELFEATSSVSSWSDIGGAETPTYLHQAIGFELSIADASGDADRARLWDSDGDDTLRAFPRSTRFTDFGDFDLRANGFGDVQSYSTSGTDIAELFADSATSDRLQAWPGRVELAEASETPAFRLNAMDFATVVATASGAGDVAELWDSSGDDMFEAFPDRALLSYIGATVEANDFASVLAHADQGGQDTAVLHGSASDDYFYGDADFATLSDSEQQGGGSFWNEVRDFEVVTATPSEGVDRATWFDSTGDDLFRGFVSSARLTGPGVDLRANRFEAVAAYSRNGGHDQAELFGASDRINSFYSGPGYASLGDHETATYRNQAIDFESVEATASSTDDFAVLEGTPQDDQLVASPTMVVFRNATNMDITTRGFLDVTVNARQGGVDSAELRGSSAGDLFSAGAAYAYLRERPGESNAYYILTRDFEFVDAIGRGGDDLALLYDGAGDDLLFGRGDSAELSGDGFSNEAREFHEVRAYGVNGGVNTRDISGLEYVFQQIGDWRGRF